MAQDEPYEFLGVFIVCCGSCYVFVGRGFILAHKFVVASIRMSLSNIYATLCIIRNSGFTNVSVKENEASLLGFMQKEVTCRISLYSILSLTFNSL